MYRWEDMECHTQTLLGMFYNKEKDHFKFYTESKAQLAQENIKINYNKQKNLLSKIKYNKGKDIHNQYYYIELIDISDLITQLLAHYKIVGINKHYDKQMKSKNEIVFYIEQMHNKGLKIDYIEIVKYIDKMDNIIIPDMIEEIEYIQQGTH